MSSATVLPMCPVRTQERVVGAEGFEPPTSCSQSRRATRLRHAPTVAAGIRTERGAIDRSQPLVSARPNKMFQCSTRQGWAALELPVSH